MNKFREFFTRKNLSHEIGRGFIQLPVSKERPPIPNSMRNHYRETWLDGNGYVLRCEYCGQYMDQCGCGASR